MAAAQLSPDMTHSATASVGAAAAPAGVLRVLYSLLKPLRMFSPRSYAFVTAQFLQPQFGYFILAGAVSTIVSLGIYYAFVLINTRLYLVGNITGWVVSVLVAWLQGRYFIFRSAPRSHTLRSLLRSYQCYAATTALGCLLLYLMVDLIGISPFIAPLITIALNAPLNFLLNKFWTFSTGP